MTQAPRLELRQSQSLVMTQQLQQSIKLLQMNALELRGFVDSQMEENPFLQEQEHESDHEAEDWLDVAEESAPEQDESLLSIEDYQEAEPFMPDEWQDSELAGSAERISVTPRGKGGEALDLDDNRELEKTLKQHLYDQLQLESLEPLTRHLCAYMIDHIDESGYMRENLEAIAEQLGTELTHVRTALNVVQRFDPCGVGARNMQECLSLQLKEKDRLDPAMQQLLKHLDILAAGNLTLLMRKIGVDEDDLRDMIAEIRALNPKPGSLYEHEIVEMVEPDVTVKKDSKGNWHVELNASGLPRVLVNRRYFSKIAAGSKGQDKKYMTERMHEANWLVKALNQRAETILKVSTAIIGAQESFFRMGIHHLRPLTLKDIAKETGYHESTISRVTTGKYLISPRGTYELKYFFTSGLSHKAGGDDVSSQTVKHLIREFTDKETVANILSDDELAARLKKMNINVARRTVAKYREALNIPSSTQRRRQKKLA